MTVVRYYLNSYFFAHVIEALLTFPIRLNLAVNHPS